MYSLPLFAAHETTVFDLPARIAELEEELNFQSIATWTAALTAASCRQILEIAEHAHGDAALSELDLHDARATHEHAERKRAELDATRNELENLKMLVARLTFSSALAIA